MSRLTRHRDKAELFVARNTARDVKQLARQMARVDDRRAASRFYTQGEDLAPVRPPRAEELKAELDRLMGDISRQLGEKAKPQAPPRSGFEHWADSPGMAAQERSAMRAARAHAPPPCEAGDASDGKRPAGSTRAAHGQGRAFPA